MEKKLVIGFFTDVFFPMIDGVVNVVDNALLRKSGTHRYHIIEHNV